MNKKQQIDDIKQVVGAKCDKHGIAKYCPERIAQGIYAAGYRKQSDVISEFVEELIKRFEQTKDVTLGINIRSNFEINRIIKIVAAEFGAEVE